jgi:hypothetical protein
VVCADGYELNKVDRCQLKCITPNCEECRKDESKEVCEICFDGFKRNLKESVTSKEASLTFYTDACMEACVLDGC